MPSKPQTADNADSPPDPVRPIAEAATSIKQRAENTAAEVTEIISDVATKEKEHAAERVSEIAKIVHGTADQLREQIPQASGLIDGAANALDRASTALGDGSIHDLMGSLGKFAREQPALFFGSAILAGIMLTRFLKSSSDAGQPQRNS